MGQGWEQELTGLLNAQLKHRPLMRVQDLYKLLYQREFGCGHLAPALETAVIGLQNEAIQAAGLKNAYQLADRSDSDTLPGTELSALRQMLDTAETDVNGFSAVHHSEAYRAAYAPHYRVVRQCYIDAWPALLLAQRTREYASLAAPALLAVDGRCGSGKSTLAKHIAEVFECPVFHLDDFFLPPALRTAERLSQPGENVHHERFLKEILQPFLAGRTVRFCPFDCSTCTPGDAVEVFPAPFAVAEGSYALHPALRGYYTASVFVTCAPEMQKKRIAARSGEDALRVFEAKWIPLEEAYFAAYDIPTLSNLVLDTSKA